MRYLLSLIVLSSVALTGLSQEQKADQTSIGFGFKSLVPSEVFRTQNIIDIDSGLASLNVNNQFGYSYGMLIHRRLDDRWRVETGLYYAKRNQTYQVNTILNQFQQSYAMINYEVPIRLLRMLQLSKNIRTLTGIGMQLNLWATEDYGVGDKTNEFFARRKSWISPSFDLSVGFDYDFKMGLFYLGASYQFFISEMYVAKVESDLGYFEPFVNFELPANYLGLELRWYFLDEK